MESIGKYKHDICHIDLFEIIMYNNDIIKEMKK